MGKSKSTKVSRKNYSKKWTIRDGLRAASNMASRAMPYAKDAYKAYKRIGRETKRVTSKTKSKSKSSTKDVGRNNADTPGALLVRKHTLVLNRGIRRSAPMKYMDTWNFVFTGVNGEQFVQFAKGVLPRLVSNVNSIRTAQDAYGTDLFQMVPRYKGVALNIPNQNYPADADVTFSNSKIFVSTVESVLSFSNLSLASLVVDVYWVMPVKNCPLNPIASWDKAISQGNNDFGTIGLANWATVNTTTSTLASGLPGKTQPGAYPSQSKWFKKYWSIKKKDSFNIEAGQIKELKTLIVYNKYLSYASNQEAQENPSRFVTGQTLVPMFVARAAPVLMQFGTGPGYQEEMVYAEAKLGVIHNQIVNLGAAPENKELNSYIVQEGLLHNTAPVHVVEAETANVFTGNTVRIGV